PPGETILFTEGEIAIGGGGSIGGNVASFSEFMGDMDVDGCDGVDCINLSIDVDYGPGTWEPPYTYDAAATDNDGGMLTYLGMSLDAVRSYADVSDLHTGSNASNITGDDYADDGGFGTMCDNDTTGAGADTEFASHICNEKPQIIVIDNYDEANNESYGPIKINGGEGRGLLIVTGDLEIAGNFTWEGMIFVMGDLKVTGTAVVYGTLMIEGDGIVEDVDNQADVYVNGSLDVFGSRPVASGVAVGMSVPRMLRWTRL
ncbi:MAG: hypothetical protein KAS88_01115, partial [Deltaproteobacteria bacterium]|nr:hypothetical protein [Deltaproteobacteria bacterium]